MGDRIELTLTVPQDKGAWTGAHLDLVKTETGCAAANVVADPAADGPSAVVVKAEG